MPDGPPLPPGRLVSGASTLRHGTVRAGGGGRRLLLVDGLWLVVPFPAGSPLWLLGAALVALGVGGLAFGIGSEIQAV